MMSEELFFILVKETSESSAPRTALLAFYTDGENIVRRLNEQEAAPGGLDDSLAASDGINCCSAFGMPPATCCTYDYQALFECSLRFRWRSSRSRMRHTVVQLLCSCTLYRVLRPVRGVVVKPTGRGPARPDWPASRQHIVNHRHP